MEACRSWKWIAPNELFHQTSEDSHRVTEHLTPVLHPSIVHSSPLTFLEAIPEGARSAHGASLLIKRHARVSQAVVTAGVKGDVLIGQAVVAHAGEVDLTC